MLTRVDFLHDINKNLLIDPSVIYSEIISILEIFINKDIKDIKDNIDVKGVKNVAYFAWLNQLLFFLSIIDNIDNYKKFNESDCLLFFYVFFNFNDCLKQIAQFKNINLHDPRPAFFKKSFETFKNILDNIPNKKNINCEEPKQVLYLKDKNKFLNFVRAVSVAHVANTDSGGGFIELNSPYICFVLNSINSLPIASVDSKVEEAFYVSVLIVGENENNIPIIFPIYINEIKEYVKYFYNKIFNY